MAAHHLVFLNLPAANAAMHRQLSSPRSGPGWKRDVSRWVNKRIATPTQQYAIEIMASQDPIPAGLRVGVMGGGCSGFQYSMSFEPQAGLMAPVFDFDGLKVFVDPTSLMYLNGCEVDYLETLEAAGFTVGNPNVKSTCGCGSSFSA